MAEGKQKDMWQHTSQVLALIANTHRDPKKQRPYLPRDFNPYKEVKRKQNQSTKDLSILKTIFVTPHKGKETPCKPQ